MRLGDTIIIGVRNLWRRKLRTVLTTVAVAIGVTAVITLVSVALSARNVFIGQVESIGALTQVQVVGNPDVENVDWTEPDLEVDSQDNPDAVPLTEELMEQMRSMAHVVAVYPSVDMWQYQVFEATANGEEVRLRADLQSAVVYPGSAEKQALAAGRFFASADSTNEIIIGDSYRRRLEMEAEDIIGMQVTLKSQEGHYGVHDTLPDPDSGDEDVWRDHRSEVTATIIGVTPPGPNDFAIFVPVEWAKTLGTRKDYEWPSEEEWREFEEKARRGEVTEFDQPQPTEVLRAEYLDDNDGYRSIVVEVDDAAHVEGTAERIKNDFGVGAFTAQDFLEGILDIFRIVEIVLGVIGSIALAVAAIGIVNTMVMSIYERTREIGVMKAVGASRRAVKRLFTVEAAMIGFIGGAFGVGIGYALGFISNIIANRFLAEDGIPLTDIIEIPVYLVIGVLVFSTLIGTLAGLYPAFRAARLDPIEALHTE